jgi:hypothetical protein
MKVDAEALKTRMIAKLTDAISFIQGNQLVQFEVRGKEYVYAFSDGGEIVSAPPGELEGLGRLIDSLRQLDSQIEELKLDQFAANKFIWKYYRMQADKVTAMETLSVSLAGPSGNTAKRLTRAARLVESVGASE